MSDSTLSKPGGSEEAQAALPDATPAEGDPALHALDGSAGTVPNSQLADIPVAGQRQHIPAGDATVVSDRSPAPRVAPGHGASPVELGRILEGERLDHFRLDAFIGGGGMGAVFRGTDTALGRTVAVKVLLRQYGSDDETIRRFQNEAQSAARLDHTNIARVYFVGEDRGWHYIVLEYVNGENIRDLVYDNGPLSLQDTVSYTLQIADALEHAKSRDVVHRDIKPSNVLVGSDGRIKLVDMGLARLHQVDQSHEDLTASGVTLGTFDYISPEQARDPRSADVRSDLYSLGCTLYFMLTGQPPFPEGTVLQKLLQHQGDEPPDPRAIRPTLPEAICIVTNKLLAKNPHDRYQDPLSLSADLLLIAEDLNLRRPTQPAVLVTAAPLPSTWSGRHLPWVVPVAILLIISLLVQYTSTHEITPQRPPFPAIENRDDATDRVPSDDAATAKAGKTSSATGNSLSPSLSPSGSAKPASDESHIVLGPRSGLETPKNSNKFVGSAGTTEETNPSGVAAANDQPVKPKSVSAAAGNPQKGDDENPSSPEKPLIVDGIGNGSTSFATVEAACREATEGAIIELAYSGRLADPERPIVLLQRKLTIRAGEGAQPVIHFRPKGPDRLEQRRSMINVAGGQLRLSNIHLVLEIPAHARSEDWSLFEAILADQIRLERCTLTIRNAASDLSAMYRNVSFFRVKDGPGHKGPITVESTEPLPRMNLELRDCVVRGEATFLQGNALHSVQLQWENGLLATTERMVEIEAQATALPDDERLEIDLQHVTALLLAGFCRMTSSDDERRLTPIRIDCTDSILITSQAPLVEQLGPGAPEEFRKLIHWNADRSFYEDIEVFWRIDSVQSTSVSEWDWTQWQEFWGPRRERTDRPLPVLWTRFPDKNLAASDHTPLHFVLASTDANPARAAATDGTSDAGFEALSLPEPPALSAVPAGGESSPTDVPRPGT